MSTRDSSNRTAAAALVYWLMVMCGLAGLSVLRMNTPREFVPLWVGSVAGVALGQTLGWLRMRVWLIAVMTIVALAVSPILFALVYALAGSLNIGFETCLLAFVPAAVCGYLSLSERGGLVAFWYPAMLWMLVILDRPAADAFDPHQALPLVAGLGGLFVVFLRSRETRRTALWGSFSTRRLAEPLSRTVLRTSPLRGASQHLWTAAVGAGALALATWVAPHLWQKEAAPRPSVVTPQPSAEMLAATAGELGPEHCCTSDDLEEQRRERVREYLPLKRGIEEEARRAARPPCTRCQSGKHARIASGGAKGAHADGTSTTGLGKNGYPAGSYWSGDATPDPATVGVTGDGNGGYGTGGVPGYGTGGVPGYGTGGYGAGGYMPETKAPEPVPEPIPEVAPVPPLPPVPQVEHAPTPAKLDVASMPPVPMDAPAPPPSYVPPHATALSPAVVLAPQRAAPPSQTPWRAALALCFGGVALHLALRVMRRQLTLRHLARPFWRETLDQRVSNHWQRMLIGLRDAGIHPRSDEQPQALAKRVGIEGMSTCATILERVRHGLRVDATDLAAMDSAAAAVYSAARAKAGATARAAALVRSPL